MDLAITHWYEQNGEEDAVCVSSRVRFARNLVGLPFPHSANEAQQNLMIQQVLSACRTPGMQSFNLLEVPLADLSDLQRLALVEHHLVSPDFIRTETKKALLVSADESICVMIGQEDHLRIQILQPGLALEKALEKAMELHQCLDEQLHFAKDDRLGYLTANPANLGTGMRASLLMHLYALEQTGKLQQLASTIAKMGLTLRSSQNLHQEKGSHYFQLSNQVTLGIDESQAVRNLHQIALQLIRQELSCQQDVLSDPEELEDRALRTIGILKYAKRLRYQELCAQLSVLRLSICRKQINLQPRLLNTLFFTTGAASLVADADKPCTKQERQQLRAMRAKQVLAEYDPQ